jgi:hypothetical protein
MGGDQGKREQISAIGRCGDGIDRRPEEMAAAGKREGGNGSAGNIFPMTGVLDRTRKIDVQIACTGGFVLESRFRFALRLPGFRAAGRLVFLFLLPGDFSLPFLKGEFCSRHGWPPFAFLSVAEKVYTKKRGTPKRFSHAGMPLGS